MTDTHVMDGFVRSRECRSLLTALGIPTVVDRQPIRIWRLSGVERLRLPGGSSVVFKYATPPFTSEYEVLADLAQQGVPVPHLRAATVHDGMLGMILDDLGDPVRDPTPQDAAVAAIRVHAAIPPAWLDTLDEPALAALPGQALACLHHLQTAGRYNDTDDLRDHLAALDRLAPILAAGADRPPFGTCHGELHPSALHITATESRLLDFAMALHGPGLLDLAAWSGLRQPASPPTTRPPHRALRPRRRPPRRPHRPRRTARRALGTRLAPHPRGALATRLRGHRHRPSRHRHPSPHDLAPPDRRSR